MATTKYLEENEIFWTEVEQLCERIGRTIGRQKEIEAELCDLTEMLKDATLPCEQTTARAAIAVLEAEKKLLWNAYDLHVSEAQTKIKTQTEQKENTNNTQ